MSGGEQILFWVMGPLSVLSALGLLFAKKAVHAALGMAVVMISLGMFYLGEGAPFLGVIQIFVYTGAVMMLFLFVVMLVGVDSSDSLVETIKGQRVAGLLLALAVMISDDHQDYYRGKSLPIFPVDAAETAEVNPAGAPGEDL